MDQWEAWLVKLVAQGLLMYVAAYLAMKGKNLATLEDVKKITTAVEDVKQKNRLILQRLGWKHHLRLAALERRLQAHQEAYALWMQVAARAHQRDEVHEKVIECQEWWRNNCLYLSEQAREAFAGAYMAASLHPGLMQSAAPSEDVKANWATIRAAGPALTRGVALPPIAQDEPPEQPEEKGPST